jgi:hypothetical protein
MALGRYLRAQGITAGVAATIPRGCETAFDTSDGCRAAKRSSQPVVADWRPDVSCNSACVWALLGAKTRHVPPGARLGVHAGKLTLMRRFSDGRVQALSPGEYSSLHRERSAAMVATTRRYMREMGIDTAVLDMAEKVPHEDVYYLSRDEIARFRIDRRDFAETPWFFARFSNGNAYISKWIVEARGPERKEYRVSVVTLRCSTASRVSLQYVRGLASDEIGRAATATFSVGKEKTRLRLAGDTRRDTIDTGGLFASGTVPVSFADVEASSSDTTIRVTEADPRLDTKLYNVIELSTHGLAASLKHLRERCAGSAQAPPWTGGSTAPAPSWGEGTSVPFVDDQARKKNPASPAGIYLDPDWKPRGRPKQ